MSQPLVVTIPHSLGKQEAVRRLQKGLGRARTSYGHLLKVEEETWVGDSVTLRINALGQNANGILDVAADHVRVEMHLPWLIATLGEKIKGVLSKEGTLMLGKK